MLVLLGASHSDLELPQLQALAAGVGGLGTRLTAGLVRPGDAAPADTPVAGAVVLVTCNRVEVYLDAHMFHDAVDAVTADLAARTEQTPAEVSGQLTVRVGAAVAAHLFGVAAGLDAMVIGEAEIAGQVSRALHAAHAEGTATAPLHQLFQRAARTAKKVQSSTELGAAGRSVASVALDVVEASSGPLAGRSALIVGTGAYARVVAAALRGRGCTDLEVYSGSERAESFAARHQARPVSLLELPAALKATDLVVACSGRGRGELTADLLESSGRDHPLQVVDLSLQPDVAEDLRAVPWVEVVDLLTVARNSPPGDTDAVIAAQDVVIAAVTEFEESEAVRAIDPAVIALRGHVFDVVRKEVDRLRVRFDDSVADELERALHRVTRSLLHTPTLRAGELARTGDAADYVAALHTLFGIDVTAAS